MSVDRFCLVSAVIMTMTLCVSCESSSTLARKSPPNAGSKARACYEARPGRPASPPVPMAWSVLDVAREKWAQPIPAPEGAESRSAVWSVALRDTSTNGTMGVIRLEWSYHTIGGESTVREVCTEFLGVHPGLALKHTLRSAYLGRDSGGRFELGLHLIVMAPGFEERIRYDYDYPHMVFSWSFSSSPTGIEIADEVMGRNYTEFYPKWDDHRLELVEERLYTTHR